MMMKVLLATDGSSCSMTAGESVARRQFPEGSHVRVISVAEPPAPLTSGPWAGDVAYYAEVERIERGRAERAAEEAAATLRGSVGGEVRISADVVTGSPKRVIVEEAEAWGADLIVVCSHGYRSWERMLLGSVSQAVALHAECSVEIARRRKSAESK